MIRLAFLGVALIGVALAVFGFQVARIETPDGDTTGQVAQSAPQPETHSEPEDNQEADQQSRLYFLSSIDFDAGDVTLILNPNATDAQIIRDQTALRAAASTASISTDATSGQSAASFGLALMGVPLEQVVAEVYQDDVFVSAVTCLSTVCGSFADDPDIELAGLTERATPYQRIQDSFDDYDAYLATLTEVQDSPDFLFLNHHRGEDLPADRIPPSLIISLPNVVAAPDDGFDPAQHSALVRQAVTAQLPAGAQVDRVEIDHQGEAVLADADRNSPVLINGEPVPFPGALFYSVQVRIVGLTDLPNATYDALTDATLSQIDVDDAFETFVTGMLPDPCADCYQLKVDGDFTSDAQPYERRPEYYVLSYYDLRDPP